MGGLFVDFEPFREHCGTPRSHGATDDVRLRLVRRRALDEDVFCTRLDPRMPAVDDRGQGEDCAFRISDYRIVGSIVNDTSVGFEMFAFWCRSIMI